MNDAKICTRPAKLEVSTIVSRATEDLWREANVCIYSIKLQSPHVGVVGKYGEKVVAGIILVTEPMRWAAVKYRCINPSLRSAWLDKRIANDEPRPIRCRSCW
ncbi:hypothetical protein TNCV_2513981 [Trichonephila clavipes]|nr:hypothetical protein TNCV_2513981 [Trichonephila clavipes]